MKLFYFIKNTEFQLLNLLLLNILQIGNLLSYQSKEQETLPKLIFGSIRSLSSLQA